MSTNESYLDEVSYEVGTNRSCHDDDDLNPGKPEIAPLELR